MYHICQKPPPLNYYSKRLDGGTTVNVYLIKLSKTKTTYKQGLCTVTVLIIFLVSTYNKTEEFLHVVYRSCY